MDKANNETDKELAVLIAAREAELSAKYGARMFVSGLACELGIRQKTVRNQVYNGTLPVRTFKLGRLRAANTSDVAAYLATQELSEQGVREPHKRLHANGRKTNAQRRAKRLTRSPLRDGGG